MIIFVLMLAFLPSAWASNIYNPLDVLVANEREVRLTQKWVQLEEEYELNTVVQDERDYSHWLSALNVGFGFFDGLTIRIGAEMVYSGILRKTFDPSVNFQNQRILYKGPHAGTFSLQYYSKKKDLAFELFTRSSVLRARETNASLGGTDAGMNFKYRHQIGHTDIFGKLFTIVEGKKRQRRFDGENEVVDPYTKFGNEINIRRNIKKFWVMLGGEFSLATDFVTRSRSYNRSSDNGFGVGGVFEMGWREPGWAIKVWHRRGSESFNVISEEPADQREFEIERQASAMEFSWRW